MGGTYCLSIALHCFERLAAFADAGTFFQGKGSRRDCLYLPFLPHSAAATRPGLPAQLASSCWWLSSPPYWHPFEVQIAWHSGLPAWHLFVSHTHRSGCMTWYKQEWFFFSFLMMHICQLHQYWAKTTKPLACEPFLALTSMHCRKLILNQVNTPLTWIGSFESWWGVSGRVWETYVSPRAQTE